jgi:outer membrane lipoprotein
MGRLGPVLLGFLLAGCVAAFPESALRSVDQSLTLAELRRAPAAHLNVRVMLGGEVLATRPRVGETEIEVLGRRLGASGAPQVSDQSEGRFLVRSREFLDPAVFAAGRRITVLGTVTGTEERQIGDLPYRYPVIAAEQIRLWAREVVTPSPYYHPYYYPPQYSWPFWWRYDRFGRLPPSWPHDPYWPYW